MPIQDRRAFSALALLCALAYVPMFLAAACDNLPFGGDVVAAFGPWHSFTRSALERGVLPLWNPHVFCGMPFMANGQSAVFYPPNLIYQLLPLRFALLGDAWAHNVLLASGTYLLARSLGQSRSAALLAAGALALSGAVSGRIYAGHLTWHATRAWTPWLLWSLLRFLRDGRPKDVVLAAIFAALQLSAGHPPVALLSFSLCAGLLFVRSLSRRFRGLPILPQHGAPMLLAALALTSALSAGTWLPLAEHTTLSAHRGLPYHFAAQGSATWKSLLRLVLPDFFGGNVTPEWSLPGYGHEEAASLGLLAAILAIAAPLLTRNAKGQWPRAVWPLWLLLPIAWLMAMGSHTPIHRLAFDYVPLVKSLRVPVRWLELWLLPASLLAGFAFDGVSTRASRPQARRLLGLILADVAVLPVLLALFTALPSVSADFFAASQLQSIALKAALIGFAVAAIGATLALKAQRHRTFRHAFLVVALCEVLCLFWRTVCIGEPIQSPNWPLPVLAEYRQGQRWETDLGGSIPQMNGGLTHQIDIFNGYDPAVPRRFFGFASALEGTQFSSFSYEVEHRNSLLRVAGVTHELRHDFTLRPYSGAWPRLYLTQNILRASEAGQLQTLKRLASGDFFAQGQPVVASRQAFPEVRKGADSGRVWSWTRDLNRVDIEVETNSPTVLVAGEAFYPGWHAFIRQNGRAQAAKIEPANYLFRGVGLPKGATHVTMIYEPEAHRLGVFLALWGLGALSCALILIGKRQYETQHSSGF